MRQGRCSGCGRNGTWVNRYVRAGTALGEFCADCYDALGLTQNRSSNRLVPRRGGVHEADDQGENPSWQNGVMASEEDR